MVIVRTMSHRHRSNSILSINSNNSNTSFNDSNSENSFDFFTCTPKFDFIKPHNSNDIKEAGYLFNIKSKNKKFLLESSSSDDDDDSQDIDKLLNFLYDKNDKKLNNTKKAKNTSSNIKIGSESTKRKNILTQRKSRRIVSNDSQICKKFCIDTDYKTTEKLSRKISQNPELDDDQSPTKLEKTTTKHSGGRKKDSQNKLLSNNKDDSKENLQTNMNNIENFLCNNENIRVTRSRSKALKHKFLFTTVDASKYRAVIKSMGGEIVDNSKDATIVVTNRRIRTCKFVTFYSGIPVVSDKCLDIIIHSAKNST